MTRDVMIVVKPKNNNNHHPPTRRQPPSPPPPLVVVVQQMWSNFPYVFLTLIVPPLKIAVANQLIHAIHKNCIVYLFLQQLVVNREVVQMWRL